VSAIKVSIFRVTEENNSCSKEILIFKKKELQKQTCNSVKLFLDDPSIVFSATVVSFV